jgi:hypothetical protein
MTVRTKAGMLALAALLAACGAEGGRSDYPADGDTGGAAPATVITPDNPGAPDSTAGMSQRTGSPGVAGTRQSVNGDSGLRSTSPASTTPGVGNPTPKRP